MTSESHIPMATGMDLKVLISRFLLESMQKKPSKLRGALESKVGALI
jgi:hypothetical protein